MLRDGFILDLHPDFFCGHTAEELRELGYSIEQIETIEKTLADMGRSLSAAAIPQPLSEDE